MVHENGQNDEASSEEKEPLQAGFRKGPVLQVTQKVEKCSQ